MAGMLVRPCWAGLGSSPCREKGDQRQGWAQDVQGAHPAQRTEGHVTPGTAKQGPGHTGQSLEQVSRKLQGWGIGW